MPIIEILARLMMRQINVFGPFDTVGFLRLFSSDFSCVLFYISHLTPPRSGLQSCERFSIFASFCVFPTERPGKSHVTGWHQHSFGHGHLICLLNQDLLLVLFRKIPPELYSTFGCSKFHATANRVEETTPCSPLRKINVNFGFETDCLSVWPKPLLLPSEDAFCTGKGPEGHRQLFHNQTIEIRPLRIK